MKLIDFKTYNELIEYFKNNPVNTKETYTETHHIKPRSEGGDLHSETVDLPFYYHVLAHFLRAKELLNQKDYDSAYKNINAARLMIVRPDLDFNTEISVIKDAVLKLNKSFSKYVNNGITAFRVPADKLDEFLVEHKDFKKGRGKFRNSSGKIWVNDGKISKYVLKEELEQFLKDNPNWKKGMAPHKLPTRNPNTKGSTLDKKWVNKDGVRKNVLPEELEEYIKSGWSIGSGNKPNIGRVRLHKDNINVLVKENQVDEYLQKGYILGTSDAYRASCQRAWDSGKRNRNISEKQKIFLSKLRKGSKWMTKDGKKTQIFKDNIEEAIKNGWEFLY